MDCAEKCFEAFNFQHQCKNSTFILDKVFTNLLDSLNLNINNHCSLYISVTESDSQCNLFMKEPEIQSRSSYEIPRKKTKKEVLHCQECDEIVDSVATLKVHNISHHGTVTCEICYKTYVNDEELQKHTETAHNNQCPKCLVVKSNAQSLQDHLEKFHTNFICKDCGKSFQGHDKLYAHEKKHQISKNACPKCGKYYTTKEFYIKHVKLCMENKIDPHPLRSKIVKTEFCNLCGKGYSTESGLRVHKRFVHGNAKHHVCPQCGKQFTAPSYLKIHMVTHTGEKNFKCEICKNRFVSKEALLYHTRRHTGEKPYSCHICDEKFVNASTRAEHVKFKHIGPTLKCDICSRMFVTANFLRQHVKRHHNPTSKLYTGRSQVPPDLPEEQNIRIVMAKES
ncbi:zinc finger protein 431-like isoform X2 [Plodia interpunctella]|nr:zinc finger protein 431-like isoform X2 [Plodia interpunctella]XP_053620876.1 zinc finger protein 431-like isoform X2 [Plodia interpunctella]